MTNLAELLRLERPLIGLDLETTGVNPERDRIIQIGIEAHYPGGEPRAWKTYVDPEMDIPAEVVQKVKITQADVTGAPPFRQLAPGLASKLSGVDFFGFNMRDFDIKFLVNEFRRAEVDWSPGDARMIDAQQLYRRYHPRTLSNYYEEYVGRPMPDAHDAGADIAGTAEAFAGQLSRIAEIPRGIQELHDFCWPRDPSWVDSTGKIVWRGQEACIGFGKHHGVPLRALDKGYMRWMLDKDFPPDVKAILRAALEGRYPRWVPRG